MAASGGTPRQVNCDDGEVCGDRVQKLAVVAERWAGTRFRSGFYEFLLKVRALLKLIKDGVAWPALTYV
jgi:hypothetical protein